MPKSLTKMHKTRISETMAVRWERMVPSGYSGLLIRAFMNRVVEELPCAKHPVEMLFHLTEGNYSLRNAVAKRPTYRLLPPRSALTGKFLPPKRKRKVKEEEPEE